MEQQDRKYFEGEAKVLPTSVVRCYTRKSWKYKAVRKP